MLFNIFLWEQITQCYVRPPRRPRVVKPGLMLLNALSNVKKYQEQNS